VTADGSLSDLCEALEEQLEERVDADPLAERCFSVKPGATAVLTPAG
jgi:hypothetical protein